MKGLRITAGSLRGRRIAVPDFGVRPTAERARQAFFNIVNARIQGARFFDLFAGTGVFALEAVSRGAASALALDDDREHTAAIARLAATWNVPVTASTGDVLRTLDRHGPFDLAYADPPYEFARYDELLAALDASGLASDGLVAIEHRRKTDPFQAGAPGLRFVRRGEYGEVWISFFTRAGAAAETEADIQ